MAYLRKHLNSGVYCIRNFSSEIALNDKIMTEMCQEVRNCFRTGPTINYSLLNLSSYKFVAEAPLSNRNPIEKFLSGVGSNGSVVRLRVR